MRNFLRTCWPKGFFVWSNLAEVAPIGEWEGWKSANRSSLAGIADHPFPNGGIAVVLYLLTEFHADCQWMMCRSVAGPF